MKMYKTTFIVETGSQSPPINRLFKAAGLADGVFIRDNSGFEITLRGRRKLTAKHIKRIKALLKEGVEKVGYIVLEVRQKE